VSASATGGSPSDELTTRLERVEIQRAASSVPGRDIVQVRTTIPVGVESGWHVHPGEEIGYILEGTVDLEIRGRPAVTLRAGDGFLVPPRTPHNARDVGSGPGMMLSTYLVETGEPLATFTG
jgi:quercetin dioxygenase-like cupin family protein